MDTDKPPFRADHVGSLLRPGRLHAARAKAQSGEITGIELKRIEDEAIREAVKLQESVGLKSITDGEMRRAAWHTDFLTSIDGVKATGSAYAVRFKDDHGHEENIQTMMSVTGKIARNRPIMIEPFKFLKSVTRETAKVSMPSPTYLHLRGGRKTIPMSIYPDIDEFWADIVAAYRAEIADLARAGCTYVQLDDVSMSFLCDPNIRAQIKADGEDPDALPGLYAGVVNAIAKNSPPGVSITMHTCRGNHKSMWMASGGYDAIAETVFGQIDIDGFFLEFDTERSGGFEPLRFVPKGKRVVLGLVSTKQPHLESADSLKRRIDAAAKFVPLDNLCLSPQCGFASTVAGNQITEEIERAKLALVVEVARDIWGSA